MGQMTFVPRVQEAVWASGGERVCALNGGFGDVGNGPLQLRERGFDIKKKQI